MKRVTCILWLLQVKIETELIINSLNLHFISMTFHEKKVFGKKFNCNSYDCLNLHLYEQKWLNYFIKHAVKMWNVMCCKFVTHSNLMVKIFYKNQNKFKNNFIFN